MKKLTVFIFVFKISLNKALTTLNIYSFVSFLKFQDVLINYLYNTFCVHVKFVVNHTFN